jgi:hypothetical protein
MNQHFASLVLGLTHEAQQALDGKLPPGAEQFGGDARQIAQHLIDTLGMLEAKTQGRLESDEQRLLTEALTALRFRFVQSGATE